MHFDLLGRWVKRRSDGSDDAFVTSFNLYFHSNGNGITLILRNVCNDLKRAVLCNRCNVLEGSNILSNLNGKEVDGAADGCANAGLLILSLCSAKGAKR